MLVIDSAEAGVEGGWWVDGLAKSHEESLSRTAPTPVPMPTPHRQSYGRVKVQVGKTEQRKLRSGVRLGLQQRDTVKGY